MPVLGDFGVVGRGFMARHGVDQFVVSLPVTMRQQLADLSRALGALGANWRFVPTLVDLLAGRLRVPAGAWGGGPVDQEGRGGEGSEEGGGGWSRVQLVSDAQAPGWIDTVALIGREPQPLDEGAIRGTIAGRCVLITGAGGSIGSELSRQVARYGPSKLVLVERSENALFEIDRAVARLQPRVARAAELHDVTDAGGTLGLVKRHRPDVIFHAAAHKHVPMMEDHPAQAVENNFFGSKSIADAAVEAGVGRFVMISTDKAVNPSSVMGATKRLAEMYIQHLNARGRCVFCMVRFGNVLGSACSVLPIWGQQLSAGGPITVTHPEMRRYFMTIPEAAGLVLQSATFSRGGEVFVLDMGEPIRIVDLARRFVALHGLEAGVDVGIEYTGVRPGEKLYEELAYGSEDLAGTPHRSVRVWRTGPPDAGRIQQIVDTFVRLRGKGGPQGHPWQGVGREAIVAALRVAVPEMVESAAG
jgi:FlaA1/EpsC-like NDP-sugar epimerase